MAVSPRVRTQVQVMFFDTDCGGVVSNIAYLRFIEIARTLLAEELQHRERPRAVALRKKVEAAQSHRASNNPPPAENPAAHDPRGGENQSGQAKSRSWARLWESPPS